MSYSFTDRTDATTTLGFNPYLYCNGTPVNNKGIESLELFNKVESENSYEKMANRAKIKNRYPGISLFRDVHRFLFGSIYGWAGEFMDEVDAEKTDEPTESIKSQVSHVLDEMAKINWYTASRNTIIKTLVDSCIQLYTIHPFFDGNLRTILVWLEKYCAYHGWAFDIDKVLPYFVNNSNKYCLRTSKERIVTTIFSSALRVIKRSATESV